VVLQHSQAVVVAVLYLTAAASAGADLALVA
jgi:hypothetical protein